jgi:hypothetical protein
MSHSRFLPLLLSACAVLVITASVQSQRTEKAHEAPEVAKVLTLYPKSEAFAAAVRRNAGVQPTEVRLTWFLESKANVAMVCTADFQTLKVISAREVYDWATQASRRHEMTQAQGAELAKLVKALPPSAKAPPLESLLLVSAVDNGQVKMFLYDRADPRREIRQLLGLTGAPLAELRK